MRVELQYREIEHALSSLYRIGEEARGAFQARLRHLKQLGFPPGTNTGRGQRAVYSYSSYLGLVFACEFARSGSAPKRTIEILTGSWPTIETACLSASSYEGQLSDLIDIDFSPDVALILHPSSNKDSGLNPAILELDKMYKMDVSTLPDLFVMTKEEWKRERMDWQSLIILVKPLIDAANEALASAAPSISLKDCWVDLKTEVAERWQETDSELADKLRGDD